MCSYEDLVQSEKKDSSLYVHIHPGPSMSLVWDLGVSGTDVPMLILMLPAAPCAMGSSVSELGYSCLHQHP